MSGVKDNIKRDRAAIIEVVVLLNLYQKKEINNKISDTCVQAN